MPAIDPPIIVIGGGGSPTPSRRAARNSISVNFDPEDPTGPKRVKTKINKDAEITSVLLEFPDMPGQEPIIISGYEVYTIKITFNTGSSSKPLKPKPPVKPKAKKAAKKRPAASKRGK